tara:strand:- start:12 stop:377 length:366 start_codon:yes stop_codon:yes gene_type:complete
MKYLVTLLSFLFISANASKPLLEEKTPLCDGDLCVIQFNASFNSANEVKWLDELTDCDINTVDIVANPNLPKEYKIVVVPTILILEDGEEVARFQANIMMQMEATRKEVQGSIDEIIMSKF